MVAVIILSMACSSSLWSETEFSFQLQQESNKSCYMSQKSFKQITQPQRVKIEVLLAQGMKQSHIATALWRDRTICTRHQAERYQMIWRRGDALLLNNQLAVAVC